MTKTSAYEVHLLSTSDDKIRPVDVSLDEETSAEDFNAILSLIMRYGQNVIQPKPFCSVSVGDVIEYFGNYFMVKPLGFGEITWKELREYRKIPQRDRAWSQFVRGD